MSINNKYLLWAFIGLACALLAPNLVYGVREAHDIKFHLMLFLSYRDAVELGTLYPRWLPDQLHGLGSPALLIYPPLASAFFVLIDSLTLHALAPDRVLGLGALLLSGGSGVAFYLWAREYASVRVALVAALFYATAPYHLNIDLYERGAMAEYAAFVWIPLIFHGIRTSLLTGNAQGSALLAISVSALFITHLLTAMLIAPLALAYALICLRTELPASLRIQRFVLLTVTAILGVALAAFYCLPAVSLLPETNAGGLYREVATTNIFFVLCTLYNDVAATGLLSALRAMSDRFWIKLLLLACAYLVLFLYLLVETCRDWRKQRVFGAATAMALMWIASGILCFALMSGMFPSIFQSPSPYERIQFLFRLLVVMEFSLVSLFLCSVASTRDADSRTRLLKVGAIASLLLGAAQCVDIAGRFHNIPVFANSVLDTKEVRHRLSPIEYFPIGTKLGQKVDATLQPFSRYYTASQPAFIASDKGRLVNATRNGTRFTVHSITVEPAQIMIQQFYFPGWKAFDSHGRDIAVFRDGASRLASYVVPAGEHTIVVERVSSKEEHWGNTISLVALALLALQLGFLIRRGRAGRFLSSPAVEHPIGIST